MKPRTRIQKEVVRLSSGLPELTDKQKAYAFEHCFKHHAYRTKGGTITCSECGHRIAERNLKCLIPEREFSGTAHIMKSLRPEKAIKCCAILW